MAEKDGFCTFCPPPRKTGANVVRLLRLEPALGVVFDSRVPLAVLHSCRITSRGRAVHGAMSRVKGLSWAHYI